MFRFKLLIVTICFQFIWKIAENQPATDIAGKKFSKTRVVFFNVENLFHPSDDSLKDDNDFTPQGSYHWTYSRYTRKLKKLAQVLAAISMETKPAAIGLCEVENRRVLEDLNRLTLFGNLGYRIIHQESDDPRGIDVAFLYDAEIFTPQNYQSLSIMKEDGTQLLTRDILRVSGTISGKFPCHFFVNHWPSRRGGQKASEKRRVLAAECLRDEVERICLAEDMPNLIIMGDFNDEPGDNSLKNILQAKTDRKNAAEKCTLFNLMTGVARSGAGTHYRKNNFIEAGVLDQFIVSGSILEGKNGLKTIRTDGDIFQSNFLISEKNGMPLRTFQGLKYLGGISDHFPVYFDLLIDYAD